MANGYAYPLKDRSVRIYFVKNKAQPHAKTTERIKSYLHPAEASLKAYVRQLVAKEGFASEAHQDSSYYLVVINYRPGVTVDCNVEFQNLTMKVTAVDNFEARNKELKLTCKVISPDDEPTRVEGRKWE